ncbi:MAG: class I SAM-dependent methyltransferase [Candidatus Aenigmarchaeota archaeon]|nr:class I SAM-dependent methyltransferase [Candidatus Aenigmarchaeota archaeon]
MNTATIADLLKNAKQAKPLEERFNILRQLLYDTEADRYQDHEPEIRHEIEIVSNEIETEVKKYYEQPKIVEGYLKMGERVRDPSGWEVRNLNKLIQSVKENNVTESILDVGCGYGHDVIWFEQYGFEAFGLDISKPLIERARTLYEPDTDITDNGISRFIVGSMTDMHQFDDASLGCVKMDASLYHLPHYGKDSPVDLTIRETHRILKDGGVIYLRVHSVADGEKGFMELERRGEDLNSRYGQNLASEEVKYLLESNGFEIIEQVNKRQGKRQRYWCSAYARKI